MTPLTRRILRIALPAMAGFLGTMLYDVIDLFWIAKLGTDAVAGASTGGFFLWMVEGAVGLATIGTAALVAQALGSRNPERARSIARQGFQWSVFLSFFLSVGLSLGTPFFMEWMGLNPEAKNFGSEYLGTLSPGIALLNGILLYKSVFNAHGDTRTEMKIMTCALALNAGLDPFLMFGWGPFPELGIRGAAVATLAGWTFGFSVRTVVLRRRNWIPEAKRFLRLDFPDLRSVVAIGLPATSVRLVWEISYPLLITVITLFGMAPLAGMAVAHRFEAIAYFVASGLGIAMTAAVGQAVGAKDFDLARRTARDGIRLATWVLLPVSAAYFFLAEPLAALLSPSPEVTAHGARYLRTVGPATIFLGWELCFEGIFSGLGNTRPYMRISLPLTLSRFPAAFVLVSWFGFGVESVWWTIALSTVLKGLLLRRTFNRM